MKIYILHIKNVLIGFILFINKRETYGNYKTKSYEISRFLNN